LTTAAIASLISSTRRSTSCGSPETFVSLSSSLGGSMNSNSGRSRLARSSSLNVGSGETSAFSKP